MTNIVYYEQLHYWPHSILAGLNHNQQPVRIQQHFHHPEGKRSISTPASTATLLISIDGDGTIAVGGSIVDGLPIATPTSLGVMYGAPPINSSDSSLSLGDSQAPGIWSIAIGNNVLTSAEGLTVCNVAVGSNNLQNLTTSGYNTAML